MSELQHPNAQATLDNFRRTPAALRRELLKVLLDEVLTSAEPSGAVAQAIPQKQTNGVTNQTPMADRAEEFGWLAAHAEQYRGEWVALLGARLIAHDPDFKLVARAAKDLAAEDAMFMFIEAQPTEDFTRFL